MNRWGGFVLLAAQALLLGGCATGAVWETGRFSRFHEPAVPSHLTLFHSSQAKDILVVYDECREGSDAVRRRAYWLEPSTRNLLEGRPPHFVSVNQAQGLPSVPVAESRPSSPLPSPEGLFALASTNSPGFTLFSTDKQLTYHQLPVYADSSGRVKQVLLTPFAVAADLSIIGGAIVYATLPGSWQSLNSLNH